MCTYCVNVSVNLQWRYAYLVVAMFEPPTPPLSRGPSKEWATTYAKSICGILKMVEVVRNVYCYTILNVSSLEQST